MAEDAMHSGPRKDGMVGGFHEIGLGSALRGQNNQWSEDDQLLEDGKE
jgi:hypothetical protein